MVLFWSNWREAVVSAGVVTTLPDFGRNGVVTKMARFWSNWRGAVVSAGVVTTLPDFGRNGVKVGVFVRVAIEP